MWHYFSYMTSKKNTVVSDIYRWIMENVDPKPHQDRKQLPTSLGRDSVVISANNINDT